MKKYSIKHLESIPHEYIVALEKAITGLKNRDCAEKTCPAIIIDTELKYQCDEDGIALCPTYLIYKGDPVCPCYKFGRYISMRMMTNLVEQWKKWAGIE